MRRITVSTLMITVAVLAIILAAGVGIQRRVQRLEGLALRYGREANRLENLLMASKLTRREVDEIIDRIHWNDAVANRYRFAAARPWLILDPAPRQVVCECGHHAALRAKSAANHPIVQQK